jgi:hypothetical protein
MAETKGNYDGEESNTILVYIIGAGHLITNTFGIM